MTDRDFLVVWAELLGDGDGAGVLARRYASDGSSLGGVFRVNTYTTASQGAPSIAARPGGPYVVVWADNRAGSTDHDIYAQRYCLNGDANGDGTVDVLDVFYSINALFAGGPPPLGCADANGDSKIDVLDVFYLINALFAGGPPPVQ